LFSLLYVARLPNEDDKDGKIGIRRALQQFVRCNKNTMALAYHQALRRKYGIAYTKLQAYKKKHAQEYVEYSKEEILVNSSAHSEFP
jgi:hypothetical protein